MYISFITKVWNYKNSQCPHDQITKTVKETVQKWFFQLWIFKFWLFLNKRVQWKINHHRCWTGTSHYLNQWWPSSPMPYNVTKPQRVSTLRPGQNNRFRGRHFEMHFCLTHWGRDKMADISQTTFSNVFSSMKVYEFRLKFHWSWLLRIKWTIFQHWFR